jgi:hypothetical protein
VENVVTAPDRAFRTFSGYWLNSPNRRRVSQAAP